jgi:DedD protein
MDEQLKQRVVGAIVLVSLGVVFIPMLLGGPPSNGAGIPASVALNPDPAGERFSSRVVPVDLPTPPPRAAPAPAAVEAPVSSGPAVAPAPGEAPRGWAVQLAAFSDPRNALDLRDRLKGLGYSAFVESAGTGGDKLTRVIVGPVREREQAQADLGSLLKATELSGMVVRFPSE